MITLNGYWKGVNQSSGGGGKGQTNISIDIINSFFLLSVIHESIRCHIICHLVHFYYLVGTLWLLKTFHSRSSTIYSYFFYNKYTLQRTQRHERILKTYKTELRKYRQKTRLVLTTNFNYYKYFFYIF